MVTSTKRGKQQSSHLFWDMLSSWVLGERAARPPGDSRSGLWRWRELWVRRGDAPSSSTAEAHMSTSNTVGTGGERVRESSPQASVRWLPFVLFRTVLHLVERKNGSLAEPRIAASGAANGKRGALGDGFRYRHGTQSAAPRPARHCPIGLEGAGHSVCQGGAGRHHDTCSSGNSFPYETRAHRDSLQAFCGERGHRRKALATCRVNRRRAPGFLQPSPGSRARHGHGPMAI